MIYELVAGLETHIELSTNTKIFCSCSAKFGSEPNTHCCPVCIGLPGTLPKLNRQVVKYAVMAGLATHCDINLKSKMDRKNYVYPDLPKAYQISQFDVPICKNGYVQLKSGRKIRINRIHMEEDAAKLIHKAGDVYVDYNRGGVPLIEIVTEPDFRSTDDVKEYVEILQNTMRYIGISDCRMQEGSMRCDVNISVKPQGTSTFGTRTEIKNMNSITFMVKAIEYEFGRQVNVLESGGIVTQETLRYSEATNSTESMRDKEDANDYRYFRDPDLVDIVLTEQQVDDIKKSLPELPNDKFNRYVNEFKIPPSDAENLIKYKNVSDFFDSVCRKVKSPKIVCNFIVGNIFRTLETEAQKELFNIPITADSFIELISLLDSGKINMNLAKATLNKMLQSGKGVRDFISESDLQGISMEQLKNFCIDAVKNNRKAVSDYLNGKDKAIKAILGNVMKVTKGRANPQVAEQFIIDIIKNS